MAESFQATSSMNSLINELSSRLIRTTADRIDGEIQNSLFQICKLWLLDVLVLLELTDNSENPIIHASRVRPDLAIDSVEEIFGELIACLHWSVQLGEPVRLEKLPDELSAFNPVYRRLQARTGIQSTLFLPLKVGDSFKGGILMASAQAGYIWGPEVIKNINHSAELLVSALVRKKAKLRIDENLKYEKLLSEISATYINLAPDRMDQMMEQDLGKLGRLLGVNRCIIYLLNDDRQTFMPYTHSGWWPVEDDETVREMIPMWQEDQTILQDCGYLFQRWLRGEYVQWTILDSLPPDGERMKKVHKRFGTKSQLSIPISVSGSTIGALSISDTRYQKTWPEDLIPKLRLFGEVFGNALVRKQSEEKLKAALVNIKSLKKQIEAENVYLREEIKLAHNFDEIVGNSKSLKQALLKVEQVAPTDTTVMISGETGTGKELIARAIHAASKRKNRPLIKVNCAALAPTLIESELYGHEKGAFTGAGARHIGRFELADGATLFLDEIGELPLQLQPKLLRVLQEGEFERVGSTRTMRTDVRVIAATNRQLEADVEKGEFRSDLWYRLNTFPISVPPLRDRLDDIPLFVSWFVRKYGGRIGKHFEKIPQKVINALQQYSWPGNVRELENIIERAVITSIPGHLQIEMPRNQESGATSGMTLKENEREFILHTLSKTGWIIEGKRGAARRLGLKPSTLRSRMKSLSIHRPGTGS